MVCWIQGKIFKQEECEWFTTLTPNPNPNPHPGIIGGRWIIVRVYLRSGLPSWQEVSQNRGRRDPADILRISWG